jgi:hypothetical protein
LITDKAAQIHDDDLVDGLQLTARLLVKCRRHVELDADRGEELCLETVGENQIPVADDAAGDAVEANDGVEESVGDHRRGVQVYQWDEVSHLGEPVDHGEDHRVAVDTRQTLDEVHGWINPYCARQVQRLEQAGRLQLLCLVALTDVARLDEILDRSVHHRHEEVCTEVVHRFLDSLVPCPMCASDNLLCERRGG